MRFGLDLLGAAKYPNQEEILKVIPLEFALGIFAVEFGEALPFLRKAAASGFKYFRIHLIWSHLNHAYTVADHTLALKLAKDYETFAINHPNCHIELSPWCEHNLPNPDSWLDDIAKVAPHCEIVNSPWKGAFSKKYKNEVHDLDNIKANNFSFDGASCFDADVEMHKAHMAECENFFFWFPECNFHADITDSARNTPPTTDLIKTAVSLTQFRGSTSLPDKWLYKPVSEKGTPCILAPIKTDKITLKKLNAPVFTLPYYGTYTDGRYRYYANVPAWKIGVCEVWVDKTKIGIINGSFRSGEFR